MSKVKHIIITVFLLLPVCIQAQFVNYGADPARFKWNTVKLEHYNLIYPRGLDSMAYRYALYLENAYPHIQKTIGAPMKAKFPVVLHPGNMSSNGMVSWAPRRMELLTTPSFKQEAQRWDKHLVTHESRHVFQTSKVMRGWFKPLYYLIGEQAAGVAAVFLPTWFLEGDAVATETAMSNAGRGRLPEFSMPYRAQMLDGNKFFSLDKWHLGSYKDYTGDYYALGYNMTSFARYKYGQDIWDKTTSRYVSHFLNIPMFSNALKHHSGVSTNKLFEQTFSFLKEEWERQDSSYRVPYYISPPAKQYTSYRYPQAFNDSMIIAVKSGLNDINSLVDLTNGKERRLAYIGTINSRIILNNNRVYWTEIVPGIRWTHENYSVLKYYDLFSGQIVTVTPRQRFISPSIDSKGEKAALSRFTLEGECQVVLIDTDSGEELNIFPIPKNAFVKELTFSDDEHIIAVAIYYTGIRLLELSISTGKWKSLLGPTSANITSPVWKDGKLYFESGLNGTNNIYYMDPSDRQTYRLTSSRFGAFNPAFSGNKDLLFFSDYQAKGYRVASFSMDSLIAEKADFSRPYLFTLAETVASQEAFNLDSAKLEPVEFTPKPYRKGLHTFKIHSWAPFYYDVNEAMNTGADDLSTIVKPGATILSQNTLNTAIGQLGWYYKDGYHHGKLSFSYLGWFPVINLDIDYGGKAFSMDWTQNEEGKDVTKGRYTDRNLLEAEAQIYIPFNLTRNHYIRGIQPAVTYYITNNKYQQFESRDYKNFQYLLSEVRFYNYRRMAQKEILPKWGYQLRLQYLNTPFNTENYGSLYAARLTTYWPGLVRNHSLMLRGGYQYQYLDGKALYIPKRLLDKTRGYNYIYQTHQQIAFKADYAFPVVSPDLSIGSLAYIRRLRANIFYDFTHNQNRKKGDWHTQSSFGGDLLFDWNALRLDFPLTTGVRLIQPIDYGNFQAEVLFSVSF
ncbi:MULTISPECIES: hypothetical protein [unclassified Parabacteroides]|uniref:TolB family protein n=1 Tax=unclassified Parabacteroides TaxID=2649774 RepID=UPI0024735219|nr:MULTISPECIES: hypothetical protein [unclassified Parabacteroides]